MDSLFACTSQSQSPPQYAYLLPPARLVIPVRAGFGGIRCRCGSHPGTFYDGRVGLRRGEICRRFLEYPPNLTPTCFDFFLRKSGKSLEITAFRSCHEKNERKKGEVCQRQALVLSGYPGLIALPSGDFFLFNKGITNMCPQTCTHLYTYLQPASRGRFPIQMHNFRTRPNPPNRLLNS